MTKKKNAAVDFSEGDSLMVDLNTVEDSSFEVLPKGMYSCIIEDCEFTYSQNAGNPMWSLKFDVTDGEYAGRKLFSHMVWAGAGLPITKKQLSRIAPELFEGPFDPESEEIIASMMGKEVQAKVTIRKYKGEDRNNVADLFADEGEDGFGV